MGKGEKFTAGRVAGFEFQPSEKGKSNQTVHWDSKTPGLGVRVTPAGAKSYIFETRLHGKTLRQTIGDTARRVRLGMALWRGPLTTSGCVSFLGGLLSLAHQGDIATPAGARNSVRIGVAGRKRRERRGPRPYCARLNRSTHLLHPLVIEDLS